MATVCGISSGTVNLMSGSGTISDGNAVRVRVRVNSTITAYDEYKNGYRKVKFGDYTGWMMTKYVCD